MTTVERLLGIAAGEVGYLEKAYNEYLDLKKSNLWGNRKYY